jgi:3D-(3,5/4)-trihydroxycyclohexane-1,2-dione acylhydrolase (decyclizing)
MPKTVRMTMAQALIRFLAAQRVARDGVERRFFGGVFGIFGHGNVAGIGQALQECPDLPYFQARNEQNQVHAAAAYAKTVRRLGTLACTSSIGPGATNMITGAAAATINRLPVLLLPGDLFARRNVAPVLQQLESEGGQDVSVNDCFRPVSRYWDRIHRPEQILTALPEAMRVLTSPSQCGAVTLCLPQDVQAQAMDVPEGFLAPRTWQVARPRADREALARAAARIRASRRPMIVCGGGVLFSEAEAALDALCRATGIPVGETQAGKGALAWDHPRNLGGVGVTGTLAANETAREADLVIGVGTRYSDFTTASKTAFQDPDVTFVNVNVAEFDAFKHDAIPLTGDARATLEELAALLAGWAIDPAYGQVLDARKAAWEAAIDRIVAPGGGPLPTQASVIGVLNDAAGARGVIVNAAGSAPGDLHKLWRSRAPGQYHLEYGYSTMGYEIPAGIGIRMADPTRDVFVLVGDGTFLMAPTEIVTAVQEGVTMAIVVVDNHGFASIGSLSRSLGSGGFGTQYRMRGAAGALDGAHLPLDYAAMARGMGAHAEDVADLPALAAALDAARGRRGPSVIVVRTDPDAHVGGCESWWDVAVAEVSTMPAVREARQAWERGVARERDFFAESRDR